MENLAVHCCCLLQSRGSRIIWNSLLNLQRQPQLSCRFPHGPQAWVVGVQRRVVGGFELEVDAELEAL